MFHDDTVLNLNILTDRLCGKVKTQTTETSLFQKDPSDLGLHYLPSNNNSFYALLCLLGNFSCFFLSADFFSK